MCIAMPFPLGNLLNGAKKVARQATTEPPTTQSPTQMPTQSSNMIPIYQCACFETTTSDLQCMPNSMNMPTGAGWSCSCWTSNVDAGSLDNCPFYPGSGGSGNESELICPEDWILQYFDVFSLNSIIVGNYSSIDGRIAAARLVQLNNFTVNFIPKYTEGSSQNDSEYRNSNGTSCGADSDFDYDYCVVSGDRVVLSGGRSLSGDVCYSSTYTLDNVLLSDQCEPIMNSSLVDFDFYRDYLYSLSSAYSNLNLTGNYTFQNGLLSFSGTQSNETIEVFDVSSLWLTQASSMQLVNVASSVRGIIINVVPNAGDNNTFDCTLPALDFGSIFSSWGDRLLWNFDAITSIRGFPTTSCYGNVLAPRAALLGPFGTFFGQLWVGNLEVDSLIVKKIESEVCWGTLIDVPTQAPTISQPSTAVPTTSIPVRRRK